MSIASHRDDSSVLRDSLAALTSLLVVEESLETVLQRVVELACGSIGGCDLASVTSMTEAKPVTIVFTDPVAEQIDNAQYDSDDGPCLQAHRERRVVSVPSMTDGESWSEFRAAADRHGVRSSLSLPLAAGDVHVGALNLYSRAAHAFDSVAPDAAVLFASQAAAAVWNARAFEQTRAFVKNLEAALETRDMIGTAKGIVMANEKLGPDEAMAFLRRVSQHRNVKLRDLAVEVVQTRVTPEA
jgi:GAF domain-containing protein